ncbi:flagellar export protein FliJ [Parvibaculum sp.]|jgi:flagellar export protein FliJ|uniref:flagellar export protein FliJ n=1 Tax=Parvibaculum sp. TaxID=2024848 RepID=UPI000C675999|nr:flagellar export protein FliJ [Parvibaculum sp.]HAC60386.1 flagellar export protein FliJ [Rhodobiaceae bacterium]MAU59694.1 flagellar export protein FliJ [Parvibaculum sp.]MBO6667782.1 flagellar export protein FliJ [Parvibaculum sp.]MBO6690645.1 flagellar export protein FliJ [Parvibaculum sp.]MBO6714982.1 flagellar export protein FliJ [Parvibaculum sp.]|tara:strand:+ start:4121 stop:4531 length:411 start_codon:yes stop_codon:yes gene_type:complete
MRNRESLIRLHKFQVDEKRRKVAELEIMLGEFRQRERDLEAQVEEEQRKAGISDVGHFAYPMFAKSVIRRRENILESIEGIERQLETAKEELAGAFRELKKYELLESSRRRKVRKEAMRVEQSELDEVALTIHRRH